MLLAAVLHLDRDPDAVPTCNYVSAVIALSADVFRLVTEPFEKLLNERFELPPVQAVDVSYG